MKSSHAPSAATSTMAPTVMIPLAGDEVLGPWVMQDDRRSRLLGLVLEAGLLRALEPDAFAIEQREHLGVVLEVGTRRIAPRVPATAVLLAEQAGERGAVLVGEPPLLADAPMPVLGEGLGHLDTEAVQVQVLLVSVVGEQLGGRLRHRGS